MSFKESGAERKIERAGEKKKEPLPEAFVSALKIHIREGVGSFYQNERSLEQIFCECLSELKEELQKLPKDKPVNVLDIGSGQGVALKDLKKQHYPNWELHGIDISPGKEGGTENVVKGEVSFLPYKSNTFDLVYSAFAYSYFPDKIRAILEALRVTKSGGVILLNGLPGKAYEKIEAPGGTKEEIKKEINILKELRSKGIKATGYRYYKRVVDRLIGRREESELIIRIQKSQGDDEHAKLPFKFIETSRFLSDHIDSYYKREP